MSKHIKVLQEKLPPLTQKQHQVYEAYYESGCSADGAAKIVGMSVMAVRSHLFFIARKGYRVDPEYFCEHAPAGWGTTHSTLHIKEGKVIQEWPRIRPIKQNADSLFKYLETRVPITKAKIRKPRKVDSDVQLEWTLADLHYGMLSWKKETGADYDMKIARALLLDSASDIFARAGKVEETVLVMMGDNFHADFYDARTERSGHVLDVDSRYPKMIYTGADTFISAIEICLQFSNKVKVIVLYGNHDKQSSTVLPFLIYYNFKNNRYKDRVEVDLSPAKAHYNYWGNVASCYHHGDKGTKQRMCANFVRKCAQEGKKAQFFYVKQAHLHRELIEDINGVTFEIVMSPMAPDGFAAEGAWESKRATVATKYHKRYGQIDRYEISPFSLALKKKELK